MRGQKKRSNYVQDVDVDYEPNNIKTNIGIGDVHS